MKDKTISLIIAVIMVSVTILVYVTMLYNYVNESSEADRKREEQLRTPCKTPNKMPYRRPAI